MCARLDLRILTSGSIAAACDSMVMPMALSDNERNGVDLLKLKDAGEKGETLIVTGKDTPKTFPIFFCSGFQC